MHYGNFWIDVGLKLLSPCNGAYFAHFVLFVLYYTHIVRIYWSPILSYLQTYTIHDHKLDDNYLITVLL